MLDTHLLLNIRVHLVACSTMTAHRLLTIDEVLRLIFAELVYNDKVGDLLAAALVCKTWSEVAFDRLW